MLRSAGASLKQKNQNNKAAAVFEVPFINSNSFEDFFLKAKNRKKTPKGIMFRYKIKTDVLIKV